MPNYTVEDTQTGKQITFEWNAEGAPTDTDIDEIFQTARTKQDTRPYASDVTKASIKYDVPEDLIHRVIKVESGYNPIAMSPKGAQGLMQLMPGTANMLKVKNPWDPAENIDKGTKYLRSLIDEHGGSADNPSTVARAVAAYNMGPNALKKLLSNPAAQMPLETQKYLAKVLGPQAETGRNTSPYVHPSGTLLPQPTRIPPESYGYEVPQQQQQQAEPNVLESAVNWLETPVSPATSVADRWLRQIPEGVDKGVYNIIKGFISLPVAAGDTAQKIMLSHDYSVDEKYGAYWEMVKGIYDAVGTPLGAQGITKAQKRWDEDPGGAMVAIATMFAPLVKSKIIPEGIMGKRTVPELEPAPKAPMAEPLQLITPGMPTVAAPSPPRMSDITPISRTEPQVSGQIRAGMAYPERVRGEIPSPMKSVIDAIEQKRAREGLLPTKFGEGGFINIGDMADAAKQIRDSVRTFGIQVDEATKGWVDNVIRYATVDNKKIDDQIQKTFFTAVRPPVAKMRGYGKYAQYGENVADGIRGIIENKDQIGLVDDAGKPRVPYTIEEASKAIEIREDALVSQFDKMAQSSTSKGKLLDPQPIIDAITQQINNRGYADSNPVAVKYGQEAIARLRKTQEENGGYTAKEAQLQLRAENQRARGLYNQTVPDVAQTSFIDKVWADTLRPTLDNFIASTEGEGYQSLRNEYAALRTFDRDVAHRLVIDARKAVKNLPETLLDAGSLAEVGRFVMKPDPANLAVAAALKTVSYFYKKWNSPDYLIKDMFQKAESAMNPSQLQLVRQGLIKVTKEAGKQEMGYLGSHIAERLPNMDVLPPEAMALGMNQADKQKQRQSIVNANGAKFQYNHMNGTLSPWF